MSNNPFGTDITPDDIVDNLSFFDDWEERYKYIIDLGKEIPSLAEDKKTDDHLIPGCQSKVWIHHQVKDGKILLEADSDALVVKGLLGIVLAAYNHKTAQEIAEFDIENYFSQIDLIKHLSPTRGNGLKAMVQRIKSL